MSYTTTSFISSDKEVASCEKNLSICLSANGFSFSIISLKDELLSLGEIAYDGSPSMAEAILMVKSAFAEHQIILFGFNKAELIVPADQFVWVPDHLYEGGNDRQYLESVCEIEPGKSIFSEHNDCIRSQMIFTADNTLVSAFRIAIPGLKIRCQHSAFVTEFNIQHSDLRSSLLVNVRNGKADFVVFCNKKLQFCNTFAITCFEDVIYNALNLNKQFHLDDASMETLLCGKIDRMNLAEMQKFLPNVDLYKGRVLQFGNPEMWHCLTYHFAEVLS